METLEIKVYDIDELSEKAKEKALEKHRHWNTEMNDWWDCAYEGLYEKLKEKGFEDCKIWFSGFWSQGDGACFDCTHFDEEKLLANLDLNEYEKEAVRKMNCSYTINTINPHYSHKHTRSLCAQTNDMEEDLDTVFNTKDEDLPLLIGQELSGDAQDLLETRLKTGQTSSRSLEELPYLLQTDLETLRLELCDEIYKALEEEYEYLTSDECVEESLKCNGVKFLEDGSHCDFA